ncbi:MAG: 30S ribosomal protein S16 [Elusimicrobiaceae bacterium]|jgi:small subunit ribosomal protein S16|nr:30S ribosomal protein S16 [Elusimicrobiaceae bacterium]
MAVVIRLQRVGKKSQPQYRVVAIEKKSAVGSEAKEVLGQYNPCNPETNQQVKLNMPRVEYWMKVGAKPSQTVASLIKKASAK